MTKNHLGVAPPEEELLAAASRLEAQLDARGRAERANDIERLRALFAQANEPLSAEDQSVFQLFTEGVLDSRHLHDHFGPRLLSVVQRFEGK